MVKILDTTLRDGSYVIDFQFTAKDTALIAAALDDAGISLIELGHGLGLHASSKPNMQAAATDEAYLAAAAQSIKSAQWGMFFIPGIGRIEDIELAAKYGMHFIRIGTDVTEIAHSEPYIRKAKELGLYVSSNFMKTYALSPEEVGAQALQAAHFGADVVCVVDSAGGMFPEDVAAYFTEIRKRTPIPLGFHGHNNLGLATANTLKAVELGAEIVDTSVRGMGRSAGNAVTEILLLALKRKKFDLSVNTTKILDIAERLIDPFLKNYQQVNSLGIISGYAQFHSSFLSLVLEACEEHLVDPRELIVKLTQVDRVNAPKELVERLAGELAQEKVTASRTLSVSLPFSAPAQPELSLTEKVQALAKESQILAKKYAKPSAFNVVQAYRRESAGFVSTAIHVGPALIMASAEVATPEEMHSVTAAADGQFNYILLDADHQKAAGSLLFSIAQATVKHSTLLLYQDLDVWARSIIALINELSAKQKEKPPLLLWGINPLSQACAEKLKILGFSAIQTPAIYQASLESLYQEASFWIFCEKIHDQLLEYIPANALVIDALIGSLEARHVQEINQLGGTIYRPNMHTTIQAEASALIEMAELIQKKQGIAQLNGIPIAAGGVIAPRGTVIVDSISHPQTIFGIAKGNGFLLNQNELSAEERQLLYAAEIAIASTLLS